MGPTAHGRGPGDELGFRGAEDGVLFDGTITTLIVRLGPFCDSRRIKCIIVDVNGVESLPSTSLL
jgi:hypothetical protein